MITVKYNNTISERDMDLLFAESVATDPGFLGLLISKTDLDREDAKVISVEISKEDSTLGESDITVVIETKDGQYGLLVEDKIDAIAMPDQHDRYIKRGEKAVKAGEYKDFRVFIFCPEKYYTQNDEAKKYEYLITYEECMQHFADKEDALNSYRKQQLSQAIAKAKKPQSVNVDEKANAFLRQYIEYQKAYYPSLDLSTKEDKNGWWTDFRTDLGTVYINHKIQEGYVDLTFPKASEKVNRVKVIADWVRQHKMPNATVVKTKKSAMIRVHVPKIDMLKDFDTVEKDELDQCFAAIKELTDFANIVEIVDSIADRKK